jgi:hypothetical protein
MCCLSKRTASKFHDAPGTKRVRSRNNQRYLSNERVLLGYTETTNSTELAIAFIFAERKVNAMDDIESRNQRSTE